MRIFVGIFLYKMMLRWREGQTIDGEVDCHVVVNEGGLVTELLCFLLSTLFAQLACVPRGGRVQVDKTATKLSSVVVVKLICTLEMKLLMSGMFVSFQACALTSFEI